MTSLSWYNSMAKEESMKLRIYTILPHNSPHRYKVPAIYIYIYIYNEYYPRNCSNNKNINTNFMMIGLHHFHNMHKKTRRSYVDRTLSAMNRGLPFPFLFQSRYSGTIINHFVTHGCNFYLINPLGEDSVCMRPT